MISNILRPAFGVCQLECITLEPLMPDAMCGGITFLG
jgi:hypothetical protein